MSIRSIAILCACLGLPPPIIAQALPPPLPAAPSQALWDPSPVPFSLSGELIQPPGGQSRVVILRPLLLDRNSGFDIAGGQALAIQGSICTPAGLGQAMCENPDLPGAHPPSLLLKLGDGHLDVAGINRHRGNTMLLQGSLGLWSSQALGHVANTLDMAGGTRLDLGGGVTIAQNLQAQPFAAVAPLVPAAWDVDASASGDSAATLQVGEGTATWQGHINASVPLAKDGAGTLRVLGTGFAPDHALDLRQGGLQIGQGGFAMGQFWFGAVHARPDTTLSGTGLILDAQVAGHLRPGTPDAVGVLLFGNHVGLADSAQTRIRIDGAGRADQVWSLGTARLGGELLVVPTPGRWSPDTRWIIVQADGGLDRAALSASDPAAASPVGVSTGDGRYARARSALRYLDPMLVYGPRTVTLGLRYNRRGLNTVDPSWRSALLDDSRFPRESALAHTGSGRAWAQTWAANTERRGEGGLPGDDRDAQGLQLGISQPLGRHWHLAAFAGWQDSRLRSSATHMAASADAGGAYRLRDRAAHLGVGAQYRNPRAALTLGAAQSHHRARIGRQADPAEPALDSRARAMLTQLWADVRPAQALPTRGWAITPWARAAWLHLRRPAAQERGGLAAVSLDAQTDRRWLTHLGILAEHRRGTAHGDARVYAQAGVRSLWGGRALHSSQAYEADPGASFDAAGLPMARHALQLDLGVHAPAGRRASATLAYTGQHGGGQMQHGAWLGVVIALDGKLGSGS